ncbi:ABC transporter permease [Kocuria sp. U4B]
MTHRNLIRLRRSPDMLVFAVLQPVMFVLLFSQVSGGSIRVEGTDCTQYLMAGIFGQTVLFGSAFSGEGMARDVKEGIVDRFRTLPMSRSAVLVGRTNADLVIMIGTGLAVGWRFTTSVGSFAAGVGLLLFSGCAFSWVMALVGMSVRSAETVSNASFVILFPLSFISNAFVQSQTLSGSLEAFADWNPVSALVQAARELFGNTGSAPVPDVWPMQHPVLTVLLGSVVLLAVLVPLCLRRFASVSSR